MSEDLPLSLSFLRRQESIHFPHARQEFFVIVRGDRGNPADPVRKQSKQQRTAVTTRRASDT